MNMLATACNQSLLVAPGMLGWMIGMLPSHLHHPVADMVYGALAARTASSEYLQPFVAHHQQEIQPAPLHGR